MECQKAASGAEKVCQKTGFDFFGVSNMANYGKKISKY